MSALSITGWRGRRGSALILCLILIVMITVLVVGLTTTARVEQATTASHVAGQESILFAQMGVDVVTARLLEGTTDPAVPWISGPGRILRFENPTDPTVDPVEVPLFSGEAAAVTTDLSVNMNPVALTRPQGVILGNVDDVMPQTWIYVRKDGTLLPASGTVPTYSATNPILGRFAFWADDTSARVNLNTAWTRRSANGANAGHPSRIDLEGDESLAELDVDTLQQFRTPRGGLILPSEVRAVGSAALGDALTLTPEVFTTYNHAPILSPFGEAKIFLTTQQSRLGPGEINYFDILRTPDTSPARRSALDNAKVSQLFQKLYGYLSRKDWPVLRGESFVEKYGAANTAQIALNLIEYVRSADASETVVEPIRADFNATAGTITVSESATATAIMGNSRRPVITEMAVHVPKQATPSGEEFVFNSQIYVEVHLPASAGGTINLVNDYYTIHHIGLLGLPGGAGSDERAITLPLIQGGAPLMNPGDYRTIVWPIDIPASSLAAAPPTQLALRFALSRRGTAGAAPVRLDIAPLASSVPFPYPVVPDAAGAALQSYSVDDPYVKHRVGDWRLGPSTFGTAPTTRALGTTASGAPVQDHDSSNLVTDISVIFPAPSSGVGSLGELGRIHTGMVGTGAVGVPWRTLRLQPAGSTKARLPDWAILDLFATPLGTPLAGSLLYPIAATANGYEARGGLVNINASLYPFLEQTGTDPLPRTLPLRMLLNRASSLTDAALDTVVENIGKRTKAANGALYSTGDFYASPGEVLEIAGVADRGEESEREVGAFIEQATARSNTFLIYSVGESVRQMANGKIIPRGTKRYATLVEKSGNQVKVVYETELGL